MATIWLILFVMLGSLILCKRINLVFNYSLKGLDRLRIIKNENSFFTSLEDPYIRAFIAPTVEPFFDRHRQMSPYNHKLQ